MNPSPDDLDYLHGRRFSNGHAFALGNRGRAPRRADRLVELARGRSVLHVGCCDHLPLVRQKMALGVYLHQNLTNAARRCVGVDTNAEGVALLRELGFAEVFLPDEAPDQDYEVCLLADVIEHVGDPVSFLRAMRRHRFGELVIATPNAFRCRNALPGPELVNTDHRFWFTPYTLCKVLVDAGYEPLAVELCHGDYATWRGALAARMTDFVPRWRDSIVVRARP
ncbi:MAG: SAM-dependent methyltransferase [Burkholderiaceae bacterium]